MEVFKEPDLTERQGTGGRELGVEDEDECGGGENRSFRMGNHATECAEASLIISLQVRIAIFAMARRTILRWHGNHSFFSYL